MYKAYRTKLKLNDRQETLLAQHAGYARWVFNWGLALWNEAYADGLKPNANKLKKLFTNHVKPQYKWMSQLSSRVYQYAFINLGEAYSRFFKGLAARPRFKKKGIHDSFTIDNCGKSINLGGLAHKLPSLGWMRTHEALPKCVTKKITISREANEWFISFAIEHEPRHTEKNIDAVGVDLGINALATLSTGVVFPSPNPYRQALKQLARFQRQLSRKAQPYVAMRVCSFLEYPPCNTRGCCATAARLAVKGLKNYEKAKLKVAKLHQRVANIRRDYLHKITTFIAKNHSTVVIEDLNVSGMMQNHCLASAISDMGFYEFRRQLEYKCQWYGASLKVVDRFYPSSQICSNCKHQQKMPLKERVYNCAEVCGGKLPPATLRPECGLSIDRDLNASINLQQAAGYAVFICGQGAADSPG